MRGRDEADAGADSTDRWSRRDWWGVVLDAPDARALAHFYAGLLGWELTTDSPNHCTLGPASGVAYLASLGGALLGYALGALWDARPAAALPEAS